MWMRMEIWGREGKIKNPSNGTKISSNDILKA
jgi:hypothetical protein